MSAPEPGACPYHPRHHPSPASIAPPRHHRCPATTHKHSSRSPARTKSAAYLRALPRVADDPQDAVVAKQYKSNKAEFEATAKYWTDIYAGELSPKP